MATKVPKGVKAPGCISQLSGDLFDEAVLKLGNTNRGNPNGLDWAQNQLIDLEYQKAKLELHILHNSINSNTVRSHKKGTYRGAQAVLRADPYDSTSNVSLESRMFAVRGKLTTLLGDMLHDYRPRFLGFSRDKEGMRNVVREAFGRATNDQDAAKYGQAWKYMAEYVRKRMEAAGARIGKLDDWGMPQWHDPSLVSKVDATTWTDKTWKHLDTDRMMKETELNEDQLYKFLHDEVYQSIVTDGAHKIDLGKISGKPQGRGLLTQLSQHRFMHFDGPEKWMAYQDEFGTSDYLTAMTDFIDKQATNIAAMETLGPNPDIGFQHLVNMVKKNNDQNSAGQVRQLQNLYDNAMGRVGTANPKWAETMSAIRSFNIPAHLGNATLSMITDPAFLAMTARINGLPVMKTIARGLKIAFQQGVGTADDLRLASQIGFSADYAMDRLISAARFTDSSPAKFMRRLSEMTVRANWMHALTIANKAAFELEYAASLARDVGKEFGELSAERQAAFSRTGISPGMWDSIRAKPLVEHKGGQYVDINQIGSGYGKEEATRLFALMHQETQYAVPTPGAEARAIQNQGQARGSFLGEAMRTGMEFKSFAVTIATTHLRRAMYQNAMNKYSYGAGLFTSLVVMGYLAHSAKEVSKGRDVPSLVNEDGTPNAEVIVKVLAQSGGLGIYGDLVFQDYTRFGSSLAETLGGPTTGLATDAISTAQSALTAFYDYGMNDSNDGFEKLGSKVGQIAQTYKPEIWQTRAIQDRAINKLISNTVDPKRESKLRKQERRRRRDLGQENFWSENEWYPERPPGMAEGG